MEGPNAVRAYRSGLLLLAALLPLGVLAVIRILPPLDLVAAGAPWAATAALATLAVATGLATIGLLAGALRRGALAALLGAGAAAAVTGGAIGQLAGTGSMAPSLVGAAALLVAAAAAARLGAWVEGRARRIALAVGSLVVAEALAVVGILPLTRPAVDAVEPLLLASAAALAGLAALGGAGTVVAAPAFLGAIGAAGLLVARGASLELLVGVASLAAAALWGLRSATGTPEARAEAVADQLPPLAHHISDAVLRFDGSLQLREWNAVAARLLGLDGGSSGMRLEDLVGLSLADLPQPGAVAQGTALGGLVVVAHRSGSGVTAVLRDLGHPPDQDQLARELRGTIEELLAARRTIELQRAELERSATIDALTGVASRGAILERLRLEIAQARRYRHPVSVVHLDIDDFANLNARHGITGGDALLREVALRMRLRVREADALGRAGSDGFLAVLPHTDESGAATFADALRHRISQREVRIGNELVRVTISAGVAVMRPGEDLDLDGLLARVAEALDSARSAGGDRIALDRLHGLARLEDRHADPADDPSMPQDSGA